jgi:hypothetical protein
MDSLLASAFAVENSFEFSQTESSGIFVAVRFKQKKEGLERVWE